MKLSASFIASLSPKAKQSPGLADASGISFHSARVKAGDAFFALPGEVQHGIAYADDALAKGAAFIVSDQPHPKGIQVEKAEALLLKLGQVARAELKRPVIGITGSAGKTSCKTFVTAALAAKSSPGNFNTPYALAQSLVEHALYHAEEILVLELGIDHAGEMANLVDLVKPSHAIITSIGPSHLLGIGTVEQVAREKASILDLGAKGFVSSQAAQLIPESYRFETYGLTNGDYRAELTDDETSLNYQGIHVKLPSLGKAMAMNALAALAMAQTLEISLIEAGKRIETAKLEPGRLEFKKLGNLVIIDDTYNSNPLSAIQSLDILRKQAAPHIAILGDMLELGSQSHQYHHELGEATKNIMTYAIGRESIAILETNPKAKHFLTVESFLGQLPKLENATVLVKGSRGMRLERVVEALMRNSS